MSTKPPPKFPEPKDLRAEIKELHTYIQQLLQNSLNNNVTIADLKASVLTLEKMHRSSGFIYVASPYSHEKESVREMRYRQVQWYVLGLLKNRQWCYSPIVHCHELAKVFHLPTDALYWMDYNCAMLSAAKELHVLCLNGWEQSVGVKNEVAFWRHARELPPNFIEPDASVMQEEH